MLSANKCQTPSIFCNQLKFFFTYRLAVEYNFTSISYQFEFHTHLDFETHLKLESHLKINTKIRLRWYVDDVNQWNQTEIVWFEYSLYSNRRFESDCIIEFIFSSLPDVKNGSIASKFLKTILKFLNRNYKSVKRDEKECIFWCKLVYFAFWMA